MRGVPTLDPRRREDIMAELAAHIREYTPEWRYEGASDDPGSALAEIFGDMFYETVDRMNSVPEKLYTEFLRMTGFKMPDPVSAAGLTRFTVHDTVTQPVSVPQGTQVFTESPEGENIVYETARSIEATSAVLQGIYFTDPRAEIIEPRDPEKPAPFFESAGGENIQKHRFSFGEDSVLRLTGPSVVEVELRDAGGAAVETSARLTNPELGEWTFTSGGVETPFTSVEGREGVIVLKYDGDREFSGDEERRLAVTYRGRAAGEKLILNGIALKSAPADRIPIDSAAFGDIPLDLETGDYCFGRRPAAYGVCYLRSDSTFSKAGARAALELDIVPVITEAPDTGTPQYRFNQNIIDKKDAVTVVPDDVFVSQVAWEYFNGFGWRPLKVSGDKNPFSCKRTGRLELTFDIPADLTATEVNAEEGYYIRARVVFVENEFSVTPRWIAPFMKGVRCTWSYEKGVPVHWCEAENNGESVLLEDVDKVRELKLTALAGLEDHPPAMYLRFDRSPHAMPLALYVDVAGRARLRDKIQVEAWTGSRFEPARWVDMTRNLLHPGVITIYLPNPLPERSLFGESGSWLRITRSSYGRTEGRMPFVKSLSLNIVETVQRERAGEERFSAQGYESDLKVTLLHNPVLEAQVWVDEAGTLPVGEAQSLKKERPDGVRLVWDDRVLTHCWVRWERVRALALGDSGDRCYELDPYAGTVSFGNGVHGRVPPPGDDVIAVVYSYGGGSRGNVPEGAVTSPVGSLPRISEIRNMTAMSGGTDRLPLEKADAIGVRRLRNRDRALSARDFEEIVTLRFPQALHVKAFPNRDERGEYAPGHVSVVVESGGPEQGRAADDLCQRVWEDLSRRCDCVMLWENRLHVVGSTVLTVSATVKVEMDDPNLAAVTQQEIAGRLTTLIDSRWRERDIGSQLRINEVWRTVRDTANVRLVKNIILEGAYDRDGVERLIPLEDDDVLPYATVRSGEHIVQIV